MSQVTHSLWIVMQHTHFKALKPGILQSPQICSEHIRSQIREKHNIWKYIDTKLQEIGNFLNQTRCAWKLQGAMGIESLPAATTHLLWRHYCDHKIYKDQKGVLTLTCQYKLQNCELVIDTDRHRPFWLIIPASFCSRTVMSMLWQLFFPIDETDYCCLQMKWQEESN